METKRVFLVHNSEDIEIMKRYVIDPLEQGSQDVKVECLYDATHFTPGRQITENIANLIQKSHCTFVFLTKTALDRNWVKYETLLALEKSQRLGRLCVTLILFDLSQDVARESDFGLLSNAMMIRVDTNKNNWVDMLLRDMVIKIKDPTPLQPVQILANLSVGQVWSHFTGYANIVLPQLRELIMASEYYRPSRFPTVEFNLIPNSARTVCLLSELHPSIKYIGDLQEIRHDRGSYRGRKYNVPVYSIEDPETKQLYYFVAQIPNTLSILSKLEALTEGSPGDKRSILNLSKGERSLQVNRFYFAYNRLVNHPKNTKCNNTVRIIHYKETDNIADILLKAIKKECERTNDLEQVTQGMGNICLQDTDGECRDFSKTVNIEFQQDCEQDVQTAESVKEFLTRNDIKVWEGEIAGRSEIQNLETTLKNCKWCIVVLSSATLNSNYCKWLNYRWRTALHQSVLDNEVRVIPILDGVNEDGIPADLSAVTFLPKQQPNYLKKLLSILQCESIRMEATVSAKDVHQGLAWAYVKNYLEINLKNQDERLSHLQKNYPNEIVVHKLFIMVPCSCEKPMQALDVDEHGAQIDPRFKQLDVITIHTEAVGGVKSRDYQLIPYRLKTDKHNYIVVVEYPNPILCLKEMACLPAISGLDEKDLPDEAWKFKELTQNIIDCTGCLRNKAKLLFFDDSQLTVAAAILEALKYED